MNTINNYSNNMNFSATIGPNAKKLFVNQAEQKKYKNVLNEIFGKDLDKNTVLDTTKDSYLSVSHKTIPGVLDTEYRIKGNPLTAILGLCPTAAHQFEAEFFRTSIADLKRKGVKSEEITKLGSKISNESSKSNFYFYSKLADAISEKHPNSKFTEADFEKAMLEMD